MRVIPGDEGHFRCEFMQRLVAPLSRLNATLDTELPLGKNVAL